MRYYSSAYPVYASTGDVAYEIYLAGCKGYCKGCHSPHTHDKDLGIYIDVEMLKKILEDIHRHYDRGFVDSINILGGEPLDNPDKELSDFIMWLKNEFPNCKFWLYTHFEIEEVEKSHPMTLNMLDYIKCGKFEEDLLSPDGFKDEDTGVVLATSNQYIINVKEKYNVQTSD